MASAESRLWKLQFLEIVLSSFVLSFVLLVAASVAAALLFLLLCLFILPSHLLSLFGFPFMFLCLRICLCLCLPLCLCLVLSLLFFRHWYLLSIFFDRYIMLDFLKMCFVL